ncbi:MAG: sugar ABC transporter ATP-binding protein, partial [Clostridiales bacterium]|nr:sugar ABC transporter ATP-binding protein [Clostridiales bacterium]
DEPLSNLDAKLRVSMRTDLKRIHQELKTTSIFVTHDQSEALSLADRIVVMNHGYIEQIGTPNDIYHDSESMFVAKFIGSPPSNFISVKVVDRDNKIFVVHSDFKLEIKNKIKGTLRNKYLNKEIVLAVRPENFTINKKGLLKVKCNIIEPQGSHIVINVMVGGEEIKIVSNILTIKPNDYIDLGFSDKISFFDMETERRIR